jgi:photosystem II stability/assembly factor-like uncharacterized protein
MGVFISKDAGATWTPKRVSSTPGSSASAVAVDPRNAKIVFLGGQKNYKAALYKSTNGGTSWKDVTKTLQNQVYEIVFDPKVANRVFVVTSGGIFRTTNGGTSWSRLSDDWSQRALVFHPTKANTLYVGGSQGVSVSADGGTTWAPLNSGLAVKYVRCLAFNKSTKVLYAGTAGGGVFKIQQ